LAAKEVGRGSTDERIRIALNRKVIGRASLSGYVAGSVGLLLLLLLLLLCLSNSQAGKGHRDSKQRVIEKTHF